MPPREPDTWPGKRGEPRTPDYWDDLLRRLGVAYTERTPFALKAVADKRDEDRPGAYGKQRN